MRLPPMRGFGVTLAALFIATRLCPALATELPAAAGSKSEDRKGPATDPDRLAQCVAGLKSANVEFTELGRIKKDQCVLEGAIQVGAISSLFGSVALPGRPILTCAFATQFATWVRDVAAPLTLAFMNSKLAAIETGQSFECRARNNTPGEKISEHAKGDAIDVTAFRLQNGRTLLVKDASASTQLDGALMRAYRATGCGYFTTILGPGSNDAHKEHFHFDTALHGNSNNYRICE